MFPLIKLSFSFVSAHILFRSTDVAKRALTSLKGKIFRGRPVSPTFSQSDFLLFVGNVPYNYTVDQFREMMSPFGDIERIFIVRSEETGHSKGYGFVEYLSKASVAKAKTGFSRQLCGRNLRIDYANPGLYEYDDLHSLTLFIDKFPVTTKSEQLQELISSNVPTSFCQVRSSVK